MPSAPHEKSTNVRLAVVRMALGGLCRVAPGIAARLATVLFRRAPRRRYSDLDRAALESAQKLDLSLDGRRLAVWRWGEGPLALLVHGWGSRGARLAAFVSPLTDAGYSVVAFDAPGHGDSAGRLSSLPQFIAAIRAVAERLGPADAIVAHSMGGAAVTLALARGLEARRAVFLAPAADPAGYSERFAEMVGLTSEVLTRMKRDIERRFGLPWSDFDVLRAARGMRVPLLVFHDRDDRDVAWSDGVAIASAWPGGQLVTTSGLGHSRIVQDPGVVTRAAAFLSQTSGENRISARGQ